MDNNTEMMRVEKVTLEDGRIAERRKFRNEEGDEVVEVYVEPKKPLKLDKRVINKHREILAEQRIQTIRNGQVVDEEVHSIEPEVRLEKRAHIQSENEKYEDGEYITKRDLAEAMSEIMREVKKDADCAADDRPLFSQQKSMYPTEPVVSAQSIVEKNVEDKKKKDINSLILYSLIAVGQVGLLLWVQFGT